MDPLFESSGSDAANPPVTNRSPLLTETESDSSGGGFLRGLRRRLCRRFPITVKKDIIVTDKLKATLGVTYCCETRVARPVAHFEYEINKTSRLKLGWSKMKFTKEFQWTVCGEKLAIKTSPYIHLDQNRRLGVTIKLQCPWWLSFPVAFIRGDTTERKIKRQIRKKTEDASGLDVKLKFKARRTGFYLDGVMHEVGVIVDLGGPSLLKNLTRRKVTETDSDDENPRCEEGEWSEESSGDEYDSTETSSESGEKSV